MVADKLAKYFQEEIMSDQHPSIFRRFEVDIVPENRFEGDLYDRKSLAERLTSFFVRLPDGAVLAIDSPWGEGKTWFGKRWRASLADQNYRTAYVDCFQKDYVEDPFSMIAGEIIALAANSHEETKRNFLEVSRKLGAALLPAATKLAVSALGHWLIGNAEVGAEIAKKTEDAIDKGLANGLEKIVAKRFENYEEDAKTVESFKTSLTVLAAEGEKPIIIFLDELDRCRPDFAVRTIERIKHFFEAPRVIFVLLLNHHQLAAAIRGMYGTDVDAESYLGKFVQLSLTLPKTTSLDPHSPDDNRRHCGTTLERLGFPKSTARDNFVLTMGAMATIFKLSLRDVERAAALYSFAQPANSIHLAWPIIIKLKRPDLFPRLLANQSAAHNAAAKFLSDNMDPTFEISSALALYAEIHHCAASGFKRQLSSEHGKTLVAQGMQAGPKAVFEQLFRRVDLTIGK